MSRQASRTALTISTIVVAVLSALIELFFRPDYIGKTVEITALTMRNKLISAKSEIIVGRQIMTCCADDITYKGLLCKTPNAKDFAQGEWVKLVAKISFEKHRVYRDEKGPVLTAVSMEKTEAPAKPVADFF